MKEHNKVLTQAEAKQVSGGGVAAAADSVATVSDGLFRVINEATGGVEGLTKPSPVPKSGNTCCCNCRRI